MGNTTASTQVITIPPPAKTDFAASFANEGMANFGPMLSNMYTSLLTKQLNMYSNADITAQLAKIMKNYYDALVKTGFSSDAALKIITFKQLISLKTLFQKPSVLFLLLFGILIELFAASTRAIRIDSIVGSAMIFGLIYMAASFLIAFYNKGANINKYLMIALVFGLFMEITVGFIADRDRGDTFYTVYFVSGMLLGIVSGRYLGLKLPNQNTLLESEAS